MLLPQLALLRTMMMSKLVLLPVLAIVASAQYAITDLIDKDRGGNAEQPSQQTPPMAGSSVSPQIPATGPQTNRIAQPAALGSNFAPNGLSPTPMKGVAGPMGAMASLLTSVAGPMAGSQGNAAKGAHSIDGQVVSQDSMAVVGGLVEAFMHKVKLQPGERSCLENNVGQLTGDVMGTVEDIVLGVKALIAGNGTVKRGATGNVVSAGIDSAMKITSLVTLSTHLIKNCVHGDALALLNTTAHHLINGTYLGKRFLVNGIDIAQHLSDSIFAFESHDFHRFGADIGLSLRKILLSNATNGTRLPEGIPEQVIIQKATDGLMKGFFVSGSAVEITDKAYPDIDIVINLHRCIAGNSPFFKELWMSAWDLFAQLSVNAQQHGLFSANQNGPGMGQPQGQPKWSGELMVAMMQFPVALEKCGIAQDMQDMFMEAIKSLNDVQVQFKFPDTQFTATEAPDRMARAVEAWTNWDFEGFGFELGTLFRELTMLAFPQKYAVDASGKLQRYTQIKRLQNGKKSDALLMVGCGIFSLSVVFTFVRARRSLPRLLEREALAEDIEDGASHAFMDASVGELVE